jgi:pimeloyl-ACP methyl ester carboxylesterase
MTAPPAFRESSNHITGTVSADGAPVRYIDTGPQAEGDAQGPWRPPIVLVHGTGGSAERDYRFVLPLLASRQRVVTLDFSPPTRAAGHLRLDHLERQVAEVCRAVLPGESVTLVGYCLGAVVATALAAHQPDLVCRLVTIAGWAKTDPQQKLRSEVWRRLRAEGSAALTSYMEFCALGGPFLAQRDLLLAHTDLEQVAPLLAPGGPGAFLDLQMALNESVDIRHLLARVRATTLVIGCTHDQMTPVRHSKALFGSIRDACYTEIASGHAVVFERPAQLVQLIDRFNGDPGRFPSGSLIPETHV